jgi:hypothetical protein
VAEPRVTQRHERVLLDPAAEVSGLGVAHDLTRVADRLQIAGDEFVERRSFRAGDLDDTVSRRREGHIGNDGCNVPLPSQKRWVGRIQRCFALCYAGAAQAIDYGILPWSKKATLRAIRVCMDDTMAQLNAAASKAAKLDAVR